MKSTYLLICMHFLLGVFANGISFPLRMPNFALKQNDRSKTVKKTKIGAAVSGVDKFVTPMINKLTPTVKKYITPVLDKIPPAVDNYVIPTLDKLTPDVAKPHVADANKFIRKNLPIATKFIRKNLIVANKYIGKNWAETKEDWSEFKKAYAAASNNYEKLDKIIQIAQRQKIAITTVVVVCGSFYGFRPPPRYVHELKVKLANAELDKWGSRVVDQ